MRLFFVNDQSTAQVNLWYVCTTTLHFGKQKFTIVL